MDCKQRQDDLLLYALGSLESGPAQELQAHLEAGCPACEGHLAEARAMLAMLPLSLPATPPPAAARDRLMRHIQDQDPKTEQPAQPSPRPPRGPTMRWLTPALAGAIAASVLLSFVFFNALSSARRAAEVANDRLAQQQEQIHQLQATVQQTETRLRLVDSPQVKLVRLIGTKDQPAGRGTLLWDAQNRQARFDAVGLRALPADKAYELWLVNDKAAKIPMGTFRPNDKGEASLSIPAVSMPGALALVAVTDEPAQGAPQPTGSFQLLGKAD